MGGSVLQRERMGDGHAPFGAQIAAVGGDLAESRRIARRG